MSIALDPRWSPQKRQHIAEQFSFLGRIGFCAQLALLSVPIVLAAYVLLLPRGGNEIGFGNLVSFGSLLVMIFTTYWFFRYIQLGERIKDPERCPPQSSVITTLWVGFWAGCLGVVFSVLLLLAAAWRMLSVLLTNPQSGMLVAPTLGTNPTYSISAIDAVGLTFLIIGLAVELVVLGLTLWLLFRMTWPSAAERKVAAAMPV